MYALRIIGFGLVGLIVWFSMSLQPQKTITFFLVVPPLLVILGQLWIPKRKHAIQVWIDPKVEQDADDPAMLRVSGKLLTFGFFKKWHEFEVEPANVWLLVIVVGIPTTVLYFREWFFDFARNYMQLLFMISSMWLFLLYLSWRWFWERKVVRRSICALGPYWIYPGAGRWGMSSISYSFVDPQGEYHGGTFETFALDRDDHLSVVFFDPTDPSKSVPAAGMIFHTVRWKD